MRKTSVLALTITLTATLIQATSASTPITAWGSCSSLEKKVTISGAPYHCIKTARGNYAYAPANVKSGAVQPRIEPTIAADKVIDPIVLKAFSAYNHASCKGTHPNFTATYLTSPTYSPEMLAKQKVLFEQAMSCYSAYFDKPITISPLKSSCSDCQRGSQGATIKIYLDGRRDYGNRTREVLVSIRP